MSKYIVTKTKSGVNYYYKISTDGKKIRVPKSGVPSSFRDTPVKKTIPKPTVEKKTTSTKTEKKPIKKTTTSIPKPKAEKKTTTSTKAEKKPVKKKTAVPEKDKKGVPPKIIIYQFGRGVPYPKKEGFKNYPIHSKGAAPWKQLSPFLIGPVEFINSEGQVDSCPIFENFWQGSKVWKTVAKQNQKKPEWIWPAEKHLGKNEEPNNDWWKWHDALLHHHRAVRRPNGKAIPEYAWWMDEETGEYEKLNTVEGRKKIYIPILKKLYRAHPVYKQMLKEFRNGQNMILIEPDGPWNVAYPEGREVTLDLLEKLVEKMNYAEEGYPKQYQPFGHAMVASMCLLEDY